MKHISSSSAALSLSLSLSLCTDSISLLYIRKARCLYSSVLSIRSALLFVDMSANSSRSRVPSWREVESEEEEDEAYQEAEEAREAEEKQAEAHRAQAQAERGLAAFQVCACMCFKRMERGSLSI